MVKIPAKGKSFSMGSATGSADERPVHQVSFTYDFWMDTTEVTQGDYDAVMRAVYPGYIAPSWHAPYGVGARYPAYQVEWDDAALYCNARSKREGLDTVYRYTGITGVPGNGCKLEGVSVDFAANGYRLPTEAEWEYACRARSTTDYSWGKTFGPYPATSADTADFSAHAVWAGNSWMLSSDNPAFGTHPVASLLPNAWGLYDMSGNVWEWCNDWYDAYTASAATDPRGPSSGAWRVLRGGSWGNDAAVLRSSQRTFTVPDYQYYFIGFRTVRPAK
ncbi:MAG: formylglycine-generating enzyme family protein [Bacteroidota bacterium]|nr:formylglycine-generating enzyme family protein [Bacteroidota bacterium]